MVKLAFYGKGGIGKSTVVTNLSVALAQRGFRVLQVGCDPKADSTRYLLTGAVAGSVCDAGGMAPQRSSGTGVPATGSPCDLGGIMPQMSAGRGVPAMGSPCVAGGMDLQRSTGTGVPAPGFSYDVRGMVRSLREGTPRTVMDYLRARAPFSLEDVVREGYGGVLCAEAGGPLPGQGCAGRAVITALEKLRELGAYEALRPDVVLYDVLGDVVCGGFASPMRRGYADYVFVLTSGEAMSLYAAANIGLALEHFQGRGYAKPGGIILNRRGLPEEERGARELAEELGVQVVGDLPRSPLVQEAEKRGMCLMQAFPDSEMAGAVRSLADRICEIAG